MLFCKNVAVQNSPSYRQCRPAPVSSKQDSSRAGPEKSVSINTKQDLSDMLIQSCNMLSTNPVAVKNSPSCRQCRPALVSSKQESGRAGPEKSVLYKHKSRIYLICSQRAVTCYLLNMQPCRNSPSYSQCRPAPVSSKQDSDRAGPEKSVLDKHKNRIYFLFFICSARAIICYLLTMLLCRTHLAISSVDHLW